VVIDGYMRIAALEQPGRDSVEAVAWPMSEAAAVLLDRSLRLSEHEAALEVGWLLAELEQRFGYGLDELARFDRSVSWVSRRSSVRPSLLQSDVTAPCGPKWPLAGEARLAKSQRGCLFSSTDQRIDSHDDREIQNRI
jgi:hypothetical protein